MAVHKQMSNTHVAIHIFQVSKPYLPYYSIRIFLAKSLLKIERNVSRRGRGRAEQSNKRNSGNLNKHGPTRRQRRESVRNEIDR